MRGEWVEGESVCGVVVEWGFVGHARRNARSGVGAGSCDTPEHIQLKGGAELGGNLRGGVGRIAGHGELRVILKREFPGVFEGQGRLCASESHSKRSDAKAAYHPLSPRT